uniref:Uncharacterized protein n=1 Tax=Trichobilharzia regenti TaxID=157069 RepID=A0AA85K5J1_TRIRE|nr:unnamed protein product [Trichobilharzia regenti]
MDKIWHSPEEGDSKSSIGKSSRAHTAECGNVVLRKLVNDRQQSLNKASEIIGSLKEENNRLKVLVDEMKSKNEEAEIDWRSKYDNLCSELQACNKEILSRDMNLLVKDA